jgi:hypothetical protein
VDQTCGRRIEKQLAERKQAQGGGPVVFPDFLKACDGEVVFAHPKHKLPGTGFPRVVAADGRVAAENAGEWLMRRLKP